MGDEAVEMKMGVLGALKLYLDFINIFLYSACGFSVGADGREDLGKHNRLFSDMDNLFFYFKS